jgi:hypothetical protein
MRGIIVNRWWAFILTLVLSVTGAVALPSVGRADGGGMQVGDPSSNPGGGDPTNSGDPDIPINTGKGTYRPTARSGRAGVFVSRRSGAGDATGAQLIWLYKYRIALQVFRGYVLHF